MKIKFWSNKNIVATKKREKNNSLIFKSIINKEMIPSLSCALTSI